MPQLTQFPYFGRHSPRDGLIALIRLCREVPAEGETFREFRARLRQHGLYDKERVVDTLRFFAMVKGDVIVPSPIMRRIAEADGDEKARKVIGNRLWVANPIIFKSVVDRLSEGVQPPKEVFNYLDSESYRGVSIPRVQLESWIHLAKALQLIKMVGIAFALGDNADSFSMHINSFDLEIFLEEDEPEKLPDPIIREGGGNDDDEAAEVQAETEGLVSQAAPSAVAARPTQPIVTTNYATPLGRERPVPVASFAGGFSDETLEETTRRIGEWWAEQKPEGDDATPADFGVDSESWMEGSDEALYRLAVAGALVFRLDRGLDGVKAVFKALESARVLDDLYYGTAPDQLPAGVDPQALMLASLVARRCAEAPDLAASLERQGSAAEAFAVLDNALGRGLFKIELFWLMRALHELGAVRFEDSAQFTAMPTRLVRDTLFRLGYLETPYAHDVSSLMPAAAAARRAAGEATPADSVISGFALAAGCAYDCGHRRTCEYACRERCE